MNLGTGRRALLCRVRNYASAMALVLGFIGNAAAADLVRIGGTGTAIGTIRILAHEFSKSNPDVQVTIVPNLGSGGGIKAAVGGAIEIAATSRSLTENESKLGLVQFEYARTPFVFAVSTKSKATAITRGDLAQIYAGKKVTWDDGSPIRIVLRPASDTDTTLVKSISPELREALAVAEQRPGVRFAVTDQDAATELENIAGAIGPSALALIISEKRPLRPLRLDGKEPGAGDAALATYPYLKSLFLVTAGKRPVPVERFISFLQSHAGRKILIENGHLIP